MRQPEKKRRTVGIRGQLMWFLCFICLVCYHTKKSKLRCIKACKSININPVICKYPCHSFQTSCFIFHKYNILFDHLFYPPVNSLSIFIIPHPHIS